jgi:hypothetical protein
LHGKSHSENASLRGKYLLLFLATILDSAIYTRLCITIY